MPYYNLRIDETERYLRLANRKLRPNGKSKYRGVGRTSSHTRPWSAQIQYQGIRHHIGTFTSEIDAAKAYNKFALRIIGPHAVINQIAEDAITE